MKYRSESILWAATSALLTAAIFMATISTGVAKAQSDDEEYYELMRVFVDTFQQIDRNYVKEVDKRKLVDAAIRGMLSELDPYSNYISPDKKDIFTEAITQKFGGVGIRVNFDDKMRAIEIIAPIAGSPAYKAGILAGDRIVEISGQLVKDFPDKEEMDKAIELLRGAPGEKVEVVVRRADSKNEDRMTLVRDIIELETVLGYSHKPDSTWNFMIDHEQKIGFARLTHFTDRSAAELREVLKSLRKDGMKAFILDLRFDPGGSLQAAIDVADLFIEEGKIVSVEGRNKRPRTWAAKRFGTFTGFPMAILVNRYSASASEIVSACLQDHDRAIVIGERSWGKGSVQNVIDLENGSSALKLTTASYQRPSGENIHRFPDSKESDVWGVTPNEGFEVKYSRQQSRELQLDRHLRDNHYLESPFESPSETPFEDLQLDKALEYLSDELSEGKTETSKEGKTTKEESSNEKAPAKKTEDKEAAYRVPYLVVPQKSNIG